MLCPTMISEEQRNFKCDTLRDYDFNLSATKSRMIELLTAKNK